MWDPSETTLYSMMMFLFMETILEMYLTRRQVGYSDNHVQHYVDIVDHYCPLPSSRCRFGRTESRIIV